MRRNNHNDDGAPVGGGGSRLARDLANPNGLKAPVSPRGRVRGLPFIGGFALIMAAAVIGGILIDRPSVFPWGVGATIAVCVALIAAGVALITVSFIRPRPLTDDDRRMIARAGKPTAKTTRRRQMRFFAAGALMLIWIVAWLVVAGARFGWGSAIFRDWASVSLWFLAAAAIMIGAGFLVGRYPMSIPRDDERERLVKLKAAAATGRIMYLACVVLEVSFMMAALAFDSTPLMYVGLGFLCAFVLYAVVSAIARSYYDRRL